MADVRAMLRAERAARAPVKQKAISTASAPSATPSSKKRKAPKDKEEEDETRKRVKSGGIQDAPTGVFNGSTMSPPAELPAFNEASTALVANRPRGETVADSPPQINHEADIDEDEWAAFERDLAALPPESNGNVLDAVNAATAIASAPLTAEELAAQAREEQSRQRSRRDSEIEGEKEDAEKALAEEFDEMEALEERVRKLRERREGLRRVDVLGAAQITEPYDSMTPPLKNASPTASMEESEQEEDFDEFMFQRTGS